MILVGTLTNSAVSNDDWLDGENLLNSFDLFSEHYIIVIHILSIRQWF